MRGSGKRGGVMSDEPVNLNVARALAKSDARLMSVADCLEDALAKAQDGRWAKCLLVLYRPEGESTFAIDCRIAGCTTLEARGLLMSQIRAEVLE